MALLTNEILYVILTFWREYGEIDELNLPHLAPFKSIKCVQIHENNINYVK